MHLQEILKAPQRTLSVEILKLIVLGSFSCQMYVLHAESYLEANIHGPSEPHISRTHVHTLSLSLYLLHCGCCTLLQPGYAVIIVMSNLRFPPRKRT